MLGLRESDLRKLGACVVCGQHLLESALPLFYRVKISRHGFEAASVRRAVGLEMALGAPLASVLCPDEALTSILAEEVDVAVHETCAGSVGHLFQLFGKGEEA